MKNYWGDSVTVPVSTHIVLCVFFFFFFLIVIIILSGNGKEIQ